MGVRRKGRELALKLLYRIDLTGEEWESLQKGISDYGGNEGTHLFAVELVEAVLAYKNDIDAILSDSAKNWELSRMPALDRNTLRIAAAEHLVLGTAPPAVIIDEAVEIVGRFSTDESGPFVNGVLHKVLKSAEAQSLLPDDQ